MVQLQGTTSQGYSFLTGNTRMIRQYANIDGMSEATQISRVNQLLFGETIVTIDYIYYRIQRRQPM